MPFAYPEIKSFAGIYKQANSFTVPDGALETAENCVMTKDKTVTKQRGFYQYHSPLSGTLNSLFNYQNTLLAAFADRISYFIDTGAVPSLTGTATALTGEAVSVTGGRVARSCQSNKNFYVTSDNGVMKLEAFNSQVFKAGTPPALDLRAVLLVSNGPLAGDTEVAYRIVFGRQDSNDNLLLGAPSDIQVITNAKLTGQAWARSGSGPYTITVTTGTPHNLATSMDITVYPPVSGSTPAILQGDQIITVTGASTYTFTVGSDPGAASGTLDYGATRAARLEASIPSELTSTITWFAQIYRSSQTGDSTVSPEPDFKLVFQHQLTSAELTAGVFFYEDFTDDILLGAELYTNPNSQEGELQANDRPPLCEDLAVFKQHVIYASCLTRELLDLQVVTSTVMVSGDFIEVKVGATTRRYVARTGIGNLTTPATSVTSSTGLLVTYNAHGLVNDDGIYISNVTGGTLTAGSYFVVSATTNAFKIALTKGGSAIAFNSESGLYFQGVIDTNNYGMFFLDSANSSASLRLRNTAQAIVKAINRDALSLVYARYSSAITDIPGKFRLTSKGFGQVVYLRANQASAASGFYPVLPTSFGSGTQVFSRSDSQPHAWMASKEGEPEAVPGTNIFPAGSRNAKLLRAIPLRDSLILVKEDGIFRVVGDDISNFTTTALDTTVFCVAKSSVVLINNEVFFLSNQGIVRVTDSSVQIISDRITEVIQPIIGRTNIDALTGAVAYDSDHQYLISTTDPNQTTTFVTHLCNVYNGDWTTSTTLFSQGVIGPGDRLYLLSLSNQILRERKDQLKTDYCGQNYPATVVSVAPNGLSAVVNTASTLLPAKGWVFAKGSAFSRISAVNGAAGTYNITFVLPTNLIAGDTPDVFSSYKSTIKLAPYHGGIVGRMKQFCEMSLAMRNAAASELIVWFVTTYFDASDYFDWVSKTASDLGWGGGNFAAEAWGNVDSTNLDIGTQPQEPLRTWIPQTAQRSPWIQPVIEHNQAGESISLQSITFTVRSYGGRVGR